MPGEAPTIELRVKRGDDMGSRSLREVLPLEFFEARFVAQSPVKSLCAQYIYQHLAFSCRRTLTQSLKVVVSGGPTEVGHYSARVKGERLEAFEPQPLRKLDGEEDVRRLRLAVCDPLVVRRAVLLDRRIVSNPH